MELRVAHLLPCHYDNIAAALCSRYLLAIARFQWAICWLTTTNFVTCLHICGRWLVG
jgi:hypothetical protein